MNASLLLKALAKKSAVEEKLTTQDEEYVEPENSDEEGTEETPLVASRTKSGLDAYTSSRPALKEYSPLAVLQSTQRLRGPVSRGGVVRVLPKATKRSRLLDSTSVVKRLKEEKTILQSLSSSSSVPDSVEKETSVPLSNLAGPDWLNSVSAFDLPVTNSLDSLEVVATVSPSSPPSSPNPAPFPEEKEKEKEKEEVKTDEVQKTKPKKMSKFAIALELSKQK